MEPLYKGSGKVAHSSITHSIISIFQTPSTSFTMKFVITIIALMGLAAALPAPTIPNDAEVAEPISLVKRHNFGRQTEVGVSLY